MFSKAKLQTVICTTQIEKAELFYKDTLGLTLKEKSDGALVFDVGGSDLRVSPVPSMTASEHTVIGFSLRDVSSAVAQLKNKGVRLECFEGFPHAGDGTLVTPDGSKVAWFRDPDGNLMSVVQFRVS